MATAQTLIDRSMRLLGMLEPGVSATTAETADVLIALNAMLDSWRNEKLLCYAVQDQTISLSSGNATRTIGATGNLVTTRPVRIDTAYIIYSSTSIPVNILNDEEWASLPDKTATSTYPSDIYYRPEYPDGKIYLYPIPDDSSDLHVLTWTPVTAFATAATSVALPPGWEDALASNLALYVAPEFEKEPSNTVVGMARNAKAYIKRINMRPTKMYTELPALTGRSMGNIITGQP